MAYYGNRLVQLNSSNSVAPVVVSNQQPSLIPQQYYQVAQPYIVQNSALGYTQNSYLADSAQNESVKNDNDLNDNDEEFIVPNTPDFERPRKNLVGFHNYYDKVNLKGKKNS